MRNHKYTPEEKRFIENNISGRSYIELTDLFNQEFNLSVKPHQMRCFLNYHNIYHPKIYSAKERRYNYRSIGSERMEDGYIVVKIDESDKWKSKQRLIWEAANGPIPKGHVVIFADRDRYNFNPENLLLVSHRELAILNKRHLIFRDADATKCGLMIAKIIISTKDMVEKEKRKKNGGVE
jgi:hypothetical protein